MRIGKLSTYYRVIQKQSTEDNYGQRSVTYTQTTEIYGQHRDLVFNSNQDGGRENPVLQEYIFAYYDPALVPGVILIDDMGNSYEVMSGVWVNDRSHYKMKVKLLTDREFEII